MTTPDGHSPSDLRTQLNQAHHGLLTIHKALIDHEKIHYERDHGRIPTPHNFLQLLIHDPFFAWLRPMSILVAEIDEFVSTRKPTDPRDGEALLEQTRSLLLPLENGTDFQRRYYKALQESPEAALAHADWKLTRAAGKSGTEH